MNLTVQLQSQYIGPANEDDISEFWKQHFAQLGILQDLESNLEMNKQLDDKVEDGQKQQNHLVELHYHNRGL